MAHGEHSTETAIRTIAAILAPCLSNSHDVGQAIAAMSVFPGSTRLDESVFDTHPYIRRENASEHLEPTALQHGVVMEM